MQIKTAFYQTQIVLLFLKHPVFDNFYPKRFENDLHLKKSSKTHFFPFLTLSKEQEVPLSYMTLIVTSADLYNHELLASQVHELFFMFF